MLGRQVSGSTTLGDLFDQGVDGLEDRLRADPTSSGFVEAFDEFLHTYGFHGADELELSSPKWGTDHDLALRIIERLRHAPDDRDPSVAAERLSKNRAMLTALVRGKLHGPQRAIFDRAVRCTLMYAPEREATKSALVRALFESRRALNELAHRHQIARDDIYLLVHQELEPALDDPHAYASTIRERRALRDSLQQRVPPFWFERHIADPSTWALRTHAAPTNVEHRTHVQGLGVSAGVVTGRARVILDPNEPAALEPDEILIAPQTDPAWTPLFLGAAGVIIEYGAIMSHAAIIARELGIPAVVGVERATSAIPTGAIVTLDGNTGRVTIEQPLAGSGPWTGWNPIARPSIKPRAIHHPRCGDA